MISPTTKSVPCASRYVTCVPVKHSVHYACPIRTISCALHFCYPRDFITTTPSQNACAVNSGSTNTVTPAITAIQNGNGATYWCVRDGLGTGGVGHRRSCCCLSALHLTDLIRLPFRPPSLPFFPPLYRNAAVCSASAGQ